MNNTFMKIGNRVINMAQVKYIELHTEKYSDYSGMVADSDCVCFVFGSYGSGEYAGTDKVWFSGDEAKLLHSHFEGMKDNCTPVGTHIHWIA